MTINHADFPSFHHDVRDFSSFEKVNREIQKIVKDSVDQIKYPSFQAKKRFDFGRVNLEGIYETFGRSASEERLKPLKQQRFPLDRKCVQNLYKLLGDDALVSFFVLGISAGIITLESSSWSQVFIELEAKFLGINQQEMAQLIHEFGGIERYKALLADDYFTFSSDSLEKDGKRQVRIREKYKDGEDVGYTLTLKRKPSTKSDEYARLLEKYAMSMDEDIDIQAFKKRMKALLEQEFNIHDNFAFREYLSQGGLYMCRSKVKLRRSAELKSGKVEDENIFWEPKIEPFAELEAPSEEVLNMMIDLLKLGDKTPLITGSVGVFEKHGVKDNYIRYSQSDAKANNRMMQMRNSIINEGLTMMRDGCFRKYDIFNDSSIKP